MDINIFEQASRNDLHFCTSKDILNVSSEKEHFRRARQIAKGQLTQANGLVWPGQLISRPDGKLYIQRPFYG